MTAAARRIALHSLSCGAAARQLRRCSVRYLRRGWRAVLHPPARSAAAPHAGQCPGGSGKLVRLLCRRQRRAAWGLTAPCAGRRLPAQVADGVRAGVPGRRRPGRRPAHARPLQLLTRCLAAAWQQCGHQGCERGPARRARGAEHSRRGCGGDLPAPCESRRRSAFPGCGPWQERIVLSDLYGACASVSWCGRR